jgi:hypothetical protein
VCAVLLRYPDDVESPPMTSIALPLIHVFA